MKENLLKIINKTALILLLLLAFLTPLLFLPLFTDIFELPKTLLLYIVISLLLFLLSLRWLLTGIKIRYDRPLLLLLALALAASFGSYLGPGRLASLLYGLPPFLSLVLLYFLALQFFGSTPVLSTPSTSEGETSPPEISRRGLLEMTALNPTGLVYALLSSGLILALWRLLSFAQISPAFAGPLSELLKQRAFTPLGSGLGLTLYLTMLFPLALSFLLEVQNGADEKPEGSAAAVPAGLVMPSLFRPPFSLLYIVISGLALILTAPWWALLLVLLPTGLQLFFTPRPVLRAARYPLLLVTTILLSVTVLFHVPLNFNNQLLKAAADFPRDLQPGLRTSWIVAVNTVRDYPFFGTGLGTFASDFSRFRPLDYNLSPVWFIRFGTSGNYLFQLLATVGLIGTGLYLLFAGKVLSSLRSDLASRSDLQKAVAASLFAFFLGNLFAVPSLPVLIAFFLLLALFSAEGATFATKVAPSQNPEESSVGALPITNNPVTNNFSILLFVPLFLLSLAVLYLTVRLGYGELAFRQSLGFVSEQKAADGFNRLQQALNINPYRDNYHLAAASLAFSLADQAAVRLNNAGYSLLAAPNEPAPSTNVSNDRALLLQLLDYAVREAKNAITLAPLNADNWASLAAIYRNMAGFVQNAGDWSVLTYRQALAADPINPLLRLEMGGLFYLAGDFENAGSLFRDAALLKNDLPNAHYNLAWAYRQKGLIGAAVNEMTVVTRLLPLDSPDYKKAGDELEQFKKLLPPPPTGGPATPAVGPEELKLATPAAELAQPKPQKVLLPEAAPEGGQASPSAR